MLSKMQMNSKAYVKEKNKNSQPKIIDNIFSSYLDFPNLLQLLWEIL